MAANHDTPMTRFLFAILKQKSLKDIDWHQVAHDPILSSSITNGHAARMRYSRFRSSMLGLEPQPRNRPGPPKARVTKKRGPRAKKDDNIKPELTPEPPMLHETTEMSPPPPPIIKQESSPYNFNSRLTPRLTPGPGPMSATSSVGNTYSVIQPRFLTPCSDTDMFSVSPSPGLTSSPVDDMFHSHGSFDYRNSPCPQRPDPMLTSNPTYPAYSPNYPYEEYGAGSCEFPHMHQHSQMQLTMPTHSSDLDDEYVEIKYEHVE
ncbi:hypothetical protein M426DRAFT_138938 [Hypoxylon sp. CI-4A]|nr:hypothetical protein M426DRAFT_138938 [Hypoxylon sp. CI-4A]